MWIALAINGAMLVAGVIGGILTGSLALLADAGHVLSDVGSIVLALIAARLALLPAGGGGPSATSARRCWRRWSTACCWSRSASRLRSPRSAASATRLRSMAAACSRLGLLGLAGNLAATLVLARGEREDINLEGVLRHSVADALGSLGVVVAGAFVLLGGSAIVDPIVGLLIAAAGPRLLLAPDQGTVRRADGGSARRPRRRRDGGGDLRRGGSALGPRPPRLDRHRRLRRARRPCRRRPRLRPRPGPPPPGADPARALRHRAHHPADGGGGRPGSTAGRERTRGRA